jgi:hypothetical protein
MEQVNRSGRISGTDIRRSAGILAFVWVTFVTPPAVQPAEHSLEYEVKAAFLLNFTKFVDWPESAFTDAGSPIDICILGKDPFGHVLDEIVQGEAVNTRKVTVRRFTEVPAPQACQVVFISRLEKDVKGSLSKIRGGVLTVGEGDGFLREGGMIAFVVENRRVRFDVNPSAAEGAELRFSSKLLSVARTVEGMGSGLPPG